MKIFFEFLHSHFRKLVVAALLTAMAGALYTLGSNLINQSTYTNAKKTTSDLAEKNVVARKLEVKKDGDKWYAQDVNTGEVHLLIPKQGQIGSFTFATQEDLAQEGELLAVCATPLNGGCWNEATGGWQTPPSGWQPQTSWDSGAVQMHQDNSGNNVVTVVNPTAATANMQAALGQHGGNTNISLGAGGVIVANNTTPDTGGVDMAAALKYNASGTGNALVDPRRANSAVSGVKFKGEGAPAGCETEGCPIKVITTTNPNGVFKGSYVYVLPDGTTAPVTNINHVNKVSPNNNARADQFVGGNCTTNCNALTTNPTMSGDGLATSYNQSIPTCSQTGCVVTMQCSTPPCQLDIPIETLQGISIASVFVRGSSTAPSVPPSGSGNPPPTSPPSSNSGPTSAPNPAPTKAPCNATCTTNDQCAVGLSCINSICPSPAAGQAGCTAIDMRCRMPSNPSSATCDGYATPTVTPVPTATITPGGPTLTPTNTPTPPSSYVVQKYQSGVVKDGESYVVSLAFTVRNTGPTSLTNITLVDILPQKKPQFGNPQVISLTTFPSGLLVTNGAYDGITQTNMLGTGSKLGVGDSAGVLLAVKYTPSAKEYSCDGKYDFINRVDSEATASTGVKLSQNSSVSYTIQQDACAPKIDLAITKEADKKTYVTGDEVSFTLKVTNEGKVNATNVAIRDYIKLIDTHFLLTSPANVANCVPNAGQPNASVPVCIGGAGNINFYIGDLAVGESKSVVLKGKTLKGGSFTNITEIIRANEIDEDSAPNNCVENGQLVKKEDDCAPVTLSGAEPTPTPTIPGNPFTFAKKMVGVVPQTDGTTNISYLITAKNTKPVSVTLNSLTDQIAQNDAGYSYTVIPASMVAIGATDQVNKNFNGKDNLNLLSLTQPLSLTASGTDKSYVSVAYTIRVTPKSASVVRLCNEATLKGAIDGTQFTLISATKDDDCAPIQQGSLEIKKSASPQSVKLGESTVYTITVTNPSKATVSEVSIEDIMNTGMQYKEFLGIIATGGATTSSSTLVVSNDKTRVLFGTYTLPGGSSVTLKFSAAAVGECAKTYQNNVRAIRVIGTSQVLLAEYIQTTVEDVTVQCTSATSTPTPTPVLSSQYDVELSKIADKQAVKLGDTVTFTVTVHNQTANTMLGLKVKDLLPTSLQYMGHETSYGTYNNLDGIWTIGNLNPDQRQTLKLVARVAGRDDLKNFAEVYAHEQKDIDSTPNNGRNGEDDNAQVELKLEDVFIAGPTKGGMLADTGYGVMVPLVAGALFFLSLIALAEVHPNHKLVIRIVNPARGSSGLSFPKLRFIIMGTVVATGIAFAVSGLSFTQTVLEARVKLQKQYQYLQELRLVDASVSVDVRNTELKCGVIIEPSYTFAEKSPVGFKITNTMDSPAVFAIPGIDVMLSVAGKSEVTIPTGNARLSFPTAGTWYILNPVHCPGSSTLGVSSISVEKGVVATPTQTPAPTSTISPTSVVTVAPTLVPTSALTPTNTPTRIPTPTLVPTNTPTRAPTPTPTGTCAGSSSIYCGTRFDPNQNCHNVCESCNCTGNGNYWECQTCCRWRCDGANTNIYCAVSTSAPSGSTRPASGPGCNTNALCTNSTWSVPSLCRL